VDKEVLTKGALPDVPLDWPQARFRPSRVAAPTHAARDRKARDSHAVVIMPRCRHDDVRVSHKFAWTLRQHGWKVTLLVAEAPEPSYLGMRVLKARAPFGTMIRPILNLPTLLRQALQLRADLYLACNPDTLAIGIALAALRRRVIYDSAEDFSRRPHIHSAVPGPLAAIVARTLEGGERLLGRLAVASCVTQEQIRSRRARCLLLENAPLTDGPIVSEADRIFRTINRPECDLCLVYAGLVTELRGLWRMLDLVDRLNRHRRTRLVLLGRFCPSELIGVAERHPAWRFVDYLGQVSHATSLAWIRSADLGLALLDPVADYPTSSITKLYEYMQYGTPFIASDFPAWRASIDDVCAGLFVDPADLDAMAAKVLALVKDPARLANMRQTGEEYIREHFNWRNVSRPFLELVENKLADGGP
jgi:glycosyltransferase involved in cell wall biosynthesis